MEYTKDVIFRVQYGQDSKRKIQLLDRLMQKIKRHKLITVTIGMVVMLGVLDFVLLSSFIQILSGI